MSNDGELPWIAKAGITVGAIAFVALALNFQSGGELFSLVARYVSGDGDNAPYEPPQAAPPPGDEGEPTDEQIQDAMRGSWDCYYDPTMNNDWHDDVTCGNGVESVRPILLPEYGFVTEDEMQAAGDAYEAELNAGGQP